MIPKILSSSNVENNETMNYALNVMRFNLLWKQGYTGEGIKIGVVDSGIDYNHPMLIDKVECGYNFSSVGTVDDIFDYNYHGTSVSALLCGDYIDYRRYGVAPNAKLIVAKSMDATGYGTISAIVDGINYCVQQGADIINCSIGTTYYSLDMENAVRNAVDKGIAVVVASGNDGHNDTDGSVREISYPASHDVSICVGAMDRNYAITDFSNSSEFVDFVAPGKGILTAYPNNKYAIVEGTSFSCPLIAGSLALLKQKFIAEFKRIPSESELYGMLMKYTREIQGVSKSMQGHGYPDFSINRKRRNK